MLEIDDSYEPFEESKGKSQNEDDQVRVDSECSSDSNLRATLKDMFINKDV